MPEVQGRATEKDVEEFERYYGAAIMLVNGQNDSTSSGGDITVTGGGEYKWSVTWGEAGFTGGGWTVGYRDFSNSTEQEIRDAADQIAFALAAQFHPCASFTSVGS